MDIVFQVHIKKEGMMATGPIKIGIDASELDSAIKKAKRLGGILRSIEKRVHNIAKKQEVIGVFFDEFAPIKEDAFKKLIDDFGNHHCQAPVKCAKCMRAPTVINFYTSFRLQCGCTMVNGEKLVPLIEIWNVFNNRN